MSDPFLSWLRQSSALLHHALPLPPATDGEALPAPAADAPVCLILSPHPDDECIVGALPLRLRREAGWRVVNLAVTLGSNRARRAGRLAELQAACTHLGFEVALPAPDGLERVNPDARANEPAHWEALVAAVAAHIARLRPQWVLMPHARDGSATHIGVHLLGRDAIERAGLPLTVAETEFWGTLERVNLMVETGLDDTARLIRALSCHVGEVSRNPYHLRLPAWLADSVRRGAELLGGAGSAAPAMDFATNYWVQRFDGQTWQPPAAGRIVTQQQRMQA